MTELRDNTFYASITLPVNGREIEIDSRPSDALALAVRTGAPIFAAEDVIPESAIEFEHEVEDTEEVVEKFKEFLDEVTPEDFASASERAARASAAARARRRRPRSASSSIRPTSCVEDDPGGLGGLGQQARLGQPGDRVGLEHRAARPLVVEHQVDAREAVAARAAGRSRSASSCARSVDAGRQLGGADEARSADLVARLEVVEVLLLRHRLDDRQRLGPSGPRARDRQLAALDVALEQHLGRRRRTPRPAPPGTSAAERGELDPERRALRGRLDDDREAEPLLDRRQRLGGAELLERGLAEGEEVGRRQPGLAQQRAWSAPCPCSACRPSTPDPV